MQVTVGLSWEVSKVFFKASKIILKYSILGDYFGLKKTCIQIGRQILNMKHTFYYEKM